LISAGKDFSTKEEFKSEELRGSLPLASQGEPEVVEKSRGPVFYLHVAAFVLGVVLLVLVVRHVGVGEIFVALRQIGFGFFTLMGIIGLRHAIRTVSMRAAIPREHRGFSFWHAFTTRLSGETISFLTHRACPRRSHEGGTVTQARPALIERPCACRRQPAL